jgi:hypothetical protein
VIGSLTEYTLAASTLGHFLGRVDLQDDDETYQGLREPIQTALGGLHLELVLPEHRSEFDEWGKGAIPAIGEHLAEERSRILGDTAALPVFLLSFVSMRLVAKLAFRQPLEELESVLDSSLDDLGLGADFRRVLERSVGLVVVSEGVDDETTLVSVSDLQDAAIDFVREVMEGLVEEGEAVELSEIRDLVVSLQGEVRDFRAEFRAQTDRLARLIIEGDAATVEALREIEQHLEAAGLDPEAAHEITNGDPAGLWDRVVRWFGGAGPRDAAEAALWVALDFVPGGVGVKLGIKLAEAVRKSIKAGAK